VLSGLTIIIISQRPQYDGRGWAALHFAIAYGGYEQRGAGGFVPARAALLLGLVAPPALGLTVRALPGPLSGLRVLYSKSSF
jgi:hypothetical protein